MVTSNKAANSSSSSSSSNHSSILVADITVNIKIRNTKITTRPFSNRITTKRSAAAMSSKRRLAKTKQTPKFQMKRRAATTQ
jgi:hypothetical protein